MCQSSRQNCSFNMTRAASRHYPCTEYGNLIPSVMEGSCCGTYNITAWIEQCKADGAVLCGIDTSTDYGSQPAIGAAMRASGLPRSAFFITSKINVEHAVAPGQSVLQIIHDDVLTPLGLDYVDLLLLHHAGRLVTDPYPHPACFNLSAAGPAGPGTYYTCRIGTYAAMRDAVTAGLTRAVGVSNWNVRDIEQVKAALGVVPAVNQIEDHP